MGTRNKEKNVQHQQAWRARRKARFEALEERFVKGTILRICPADESGKQEIKLILDADAQEVGAELAGMFGKNVDEFMEEQLKLNIAKLPKRKQEPRSPDVQGAFDRMKITLSVIPSTATTKPRLNVCLRLRHPGGPGTVRSLRRCRVGGLANPIGRQLSYGCSPESQRAAW